MVILCGAAILASGCAEPQSMMKARSEVEAGIIGKWHDTRFGEASPEYEFSANHAFKYSQASPKMTWTGQYEVVSPNLLILTGGPRGDEAMQIIFRGNTLNKIMSDGVLEPLKKVSD